MRFQGLVLVLIVLFNYFIIWLLPSSVLSFRCWLVFQAQLIQDSVVLLGRSSSSFLLLVVLFSSTSSLEFVSLTPPHLSTVLYPICSPLYIAVFALEDDRLGWPLALECDASVFPVNICCSFKSFVHLDICFPLF